MSGKYVPPGLRKQSLQQPQENDKPKPKFQNDDKRVSLKELHDHYWPIKDDLKSHDSTNGHNQTLHGSAEQPGKLTYIILFYNANPRWREDNIIFTKSSLHLLPGYPADGESQIAHAEEQSNTEASQQDCKEEAEAADDTFKAAAKESSEPVAVFRELFKKPSTRTIVFEGWYQIDKVSFIEPQSQELARMLAQKWTRKDRFGKEIKVQREGPKWQESMRHHWAVIKLTKAQTELEAPKIERLPDDHLAPQAPQKSVNEMLAEMRVGAQKPEEKSDES